MSAVLPGADAIARALAGVGRRRREYTVVGDAVNVVARIAELTRVRGMPILVSEETRQQAGAEIGFTAAGTVTVRGRSAPVVTWAPVGAPAVS